jgi:tetratricopeptide (TPR) repeat protein
VNLVQRIERAVVLMAFVAVGLTSHAQQDSSLTRLFGSMSAKERNRIAKQEQEEAAKDAKYQAVMEQGDALFREQRFEEALAAYRTAREMRPYNVYPKVRIQDLQALIARKQVEEAVQAEPQAEDRSIGEAPVTAVESTPPAEPTAPPVQERSVVEEPAQTPPMERPRPSDADVPRPGPVKPASEPKPRPTPVVSAPVERTPARAAEPLIDGMEERVFKEGRSVVVERIVVVDGHAVVYRKVMHPWGGAAWFKDGIAITERAWDEVFGR